MKTFTIMALCILSLNSFAGVVINKKANKKIEVTCIEKLKAEWTTGAVNNYYTVAQEESTKVGFISKK